MENQIDYEKMRQSYTSAFSEDEDGSTNNVEDTAEEVEAAACEADIQTENTEQPAAANAADEEMKICIRQQQIIDKLTALVQKQNEQIAALSAWADAIGRIEKALAQFSPYQGRIESLTSAVERMTAALNALRNNSGGDSIPDELEKLIRRIEKANLDMLRDSKNFQTTQYARQQKELESYRKSNAEMAYAAILSEFASLRNQAASVIGKVTDENQKQTLEAMIVESMDELLEEYNVVIASTAVGQRRSLRTTQSRKTIPTGDKQLHGTVARSYSPSFVLNNLVMIKEPVDVYVFDETLVPAVEKADAVECVQEEIMSAAAVETNTEQADE